jgi:hypothetical protein
VGARAAPSNRSNGGDLCLAGECGEREVRCTLGARHSLHFSECCDGGAGFEPAKAEPTGLQPVGDASPQQPATPNWILDTELHHALEDPDALRGIAQLTARWAAAFLLDPDGVTRTKTLGIERMSGKLRDALPGGHAPLRAAVWEFLRPMLSPTLAAMHRDAFLADRPIDTTVRLAEHRGDSELEDLNGDG